MGHIASMYVDQEQEEKADPILRNSLGTLISKLGETHLRTTEVRVFLGDCLRKQGRYDEAETLLLKAYDYLADQRGLQTKVQDNLYKLYTAWGKPDEAAKYVDGNP